jgi:hypothetical protein
VIEIIPGSALGMIDLRHWHTQQTISRSLLNQII